MILLARVVLAGVTIAVVMLSMPMLEPPDQTARPTVPPPPRYGRGAQPTHSGACHRSLVVGSDALPELLTLGQDPQAA